MILSAEFFPLLQVPLCVAQIKAEELELSAFSDVYATFQVPPGDSLVVLVDHWCAGMQTWNTPAAVNRKDTYLLMPRNIADLLEM